jgi:CMP/dCMP kinase
VIVTLDGPAGSGKSTTARAVANRLGFRHLDSGGFYRTLTLAALRRGIDADAWDRLSPDLLASLGVNAVAAPDGYRMHIGDEDVSAAIRAADVTAHVSRMARVPAVRTWLLDQLRGAASAGDLVADGRDMGTVVFPGADVKLFLTAELDTRARRRLLEQETAEPDAGAVREETVRLAERDRVDMERPVAPLRPAPDAIHLDTTHLDFDEQVDRIVSIVRERLQQRS